MKKALILVLVVMICLVGYYAWSFAEGDSGFGNATITDKVERIEIGWTSGSVTVAYHDADTIILEETSDRQINGDDRLRWKLDGTKLVIEYNTPVLFRFFSPEKALTVTLPRSIRLKKAEINATSADISVPELTAEEVVLGSTSGSVTAGVIASVVTGESTSGDVTMKLTGKTDRVKMGSTSGRLSLTMEETDKAELDTTSGGISLEAENLKQADLGSTSGDITVKVKWFGKMKISATSGDVNAELSSDPGFTAEVSATSGNFDSALALMKDGDSWHCGDGSAKLEIGTTSGDVRLTELK